MRMHVDLYAHMKRTLLPTIFSSAFNPNLNLTEMGFFSADRKISTWRLMAVTRLLIAAPNPCKIEKSTAFDGGAVRVRKSEAAQSRQHLPCRSHLSKGSRGSAGTRSHQGRSQAIGRRIAASSRRSSRATAPKSELADGL